MRLENQTPFPAHLLRIDLGEPEYRAAVILKATYDLAADGRLRPSAEPFPIRPNALQTPFGMFHGDHHYRLGGADFCILGTLRCSRAVTQTVVTARVGRHVNRLRVTGNRVWREPGDRRSRDLTPSDPEPFTDMPLSYSRAFGGQALFQGEKAAWPDNPDGLGYYLTREEALDKPLPNIEPADGPFIRLWEDRPPVAGWGPYPMFWGMRAREGIELDTARYAVKALHPRLYNNAHPSLVVDRVNPGDRVEIEGLREAPLRFVVPADLARVQVELGRNVSTVTAQIDGVFFWADAAKVVVIQRAYFRYRALPGEVRRAVITLVPASGPGR